MKLLIRSLLIFACVANATFSSASDPANALHDAGHLTGKELVFCFQGKGTSFAYDIGVAEAAFEHVSSLGEGSVIVTGSSSGSILAAYFACRGFSQASLDELKAEYQTVDVSQMRMNENVKQKMLRLATGQRSELPREVLRRLLAIVLGISNDNELGSIARVVEQSTVVPKFPFVIVAGNYEVLQNKSDSSESVTVRRLFNLSDYSVSWSDADFQRYQLDRDAFARNYSNIQLGETPYIGKACTYFCDESTFALLSSIPENERLADLRLVQTPADLALAIQASVAEPTYFDPIEEVDYSKLHVSGALGQLGNTKRRLYCGGFIMPVVAQDLRRAVPNAHVVGTGGARLPILARSFLEDQFGIDMNRIHQRCAWWLDAQINMPESFRRQMIVRRLPPQEEYQYGLQVARSTFAGEPHLPDFVLPPDLEFRRPVAAIVASNDETPVVDLPPLQTLRGFGDLVDSPRSDIK